MFRPEKKYFSKTAGVVLLMLKFIKMPSSLSSRSNPLLSFGINCRIVALNLDAFCLEKMERITNKMQSQPMNKIPTLAKKIIYGLKG